jgi:hypothetical protein
MATDSSADKRGLHSSGRKEQTTRHADESSPATSPVPGAFGKEGLDRETEGKPQVPAEPDDEPVEVDDDDPSN